MRTSDSVTELLSALVKARRAFAPLVRESTGQVGQNREYRYADLSSLLSATLTPLLDNHLVPVQTVDAERGVLVTRLLHITGQWIESTYPLDLQQSPQQLGSQLTYSRRYSLQAMLCTAAEDDDGVQASAVVTRKARSSARPPAIPQTPAPAPPPAPAASSAATPDYPRVTERQVKLLQATRKDHGWSDEDFHTEIERAFGPTSVKDLHRADVDQLLNLLKRRPKVRGPGPVADREVGEEG